jgi:hypothetical protein
MKTCGGVTYTCKNNLWTWVFGFTPRLHYPRGKFFRCPLSRMFDMTHSQTGRFWEQINLLPLPGIKPRFVRYHFFNLVTILTELGSYILVLKLFIDVSSLQILFSARCWKLLYFAKDLRPLSWEATQWPCYSATHTLRSHRKCVNCECRFNFHSCFEKKIIFPLN